MRIFRKDYKINFVDNNDVLVGYDFESSCCERFGYTFTEEPLKEINYETKLLENNPEDLDSYIFNPSYFSEAGKEDDNIATFELCNGLKVMYLNLYNLSNGYYGHGWEISIKGQKIKEGTL